MRQYLAAALSIIVGIGPAAAVDLGVGVQGGGVGLGTGLSVGGGGVSLGIGTSTGGLGGIGAGMSVGGVSAGIGGGLTGATGGLSVGTKTGASSAATAAAPGNAPTSASIAPVEGFRPSVALPWSLRPAGQSGRAPWGAIEIVPGTPSTVVRACREAIESAATPFGVVSVRAKSAGTPRRLAEGVVSAPVHVRIHYARQGGAEIRQARIRCQLDATGRVIKLI